MVFLERSVPTLASALDLIPLAVQGSREEAYVWKFEVGGILDYLPIFEQRSIFQKHTYVDTVTFLIN